MANHDLIPNPGYALAGVTSLQQGQLSYLLAGKNTFPSEFERHIEDGILSPIWQKNLTECGCSQDGCFKYSAYCHAGQDWGDTIFVSTSVMLGHWEQLGKTQSIKDSASSLLRNLLENSYFEYKNLYWSKISNR